MGQLDQLRDRGDVGFTRHIVSADVHSVPRSASSFDPSSLLFPFSDSGFSSLSAPPPFASFTASLSSSLSVASASSSSFSSSTVPTFSLLSVVFCSFDSSSFGSSSSSYFFLFCCSSSWFRFFLCLFAGGFGFLFSSFYLFGSSPLVGRSSFFFCPFSLLCSFDSSFLLFFLFFFSSGFCLASG